MPWRTRAGLAGQAAAGNGGDDVDTGRRGWRATIGCSHDHLQHRTARNRLAEFLVVDDDLAGAGPDPDAGDGVLALAGGVGAALLVQLLDMDGRGGFGWAAAVTRSCRDGRSAMVRQPSCSWEFSAATSSSDGLLRLVRMGRRRRRRGDCRTGGGRAAPAAACARRPSRSRARGSGPRGSGAGCAP